jgi:DHA2 family multidrug resistance protein-like MFS transporter
VAISGELPAQLGAAVLDTAREAFVHGMQLTSGIAAIVAVGIAVVAVVMLRANEIPPSETRSESAVAPPEHVAHIAPTQFRAAGG